MALIINTNISALNAQRNLTKSQGTLARSMERLSSGLRINSAKDDAAGLAIADRMTSQIRGLNQCVRNANDGISLAQTAEGALQESSNILQRIRELSIQSANDSNSASDRAAIQKEVTQLQAELSRIADETTFNAKNLLDGTFAAQKFHVGTEANQTIEISIGSARATSMGAQQLNGTATQDHVGATTLAPAALTTATGTINGVAGDDLTISGPLGIGMATIAANMSAAEIASAVNTVTGDTGVTASAGNSVVIDAVATGTISFTLTSEQSGTVIGSAGTISAVVTDANDLSTLRDAINAESSKTGISATLSTGGDAITLTNNDGSDIVIEGVSNNDASDTAAVMNVGGVTLADVDLTADGSATDSILHGGKVEFSASSAFSVSGDAGTDVLTAAAQSSTLSSVADIDVSTQSGANAALNVVDEALSFISSARADLGAVQNRMESTIANLMAISENVSAARARITDADIAMETTLMTKASIMQQAGVAILAQANQTPQLALSLLS
jgi:flagellin